MKILAILDHERFEDDYIEIALDVAPHVAMVWYRIKLKDESDIIYRCKKLRQALPNSKLILSNNVEIARGVKFDGVHFNKSSYVGKKFPDLIIGYSAHSIEECMSVKADYYTLSPIFYVANKGVALGAIKVPKDNVYALGGVTLENCKSLEGLGYEGIAGISLCQEIHKARVK